MTKNAKKNEKRESVKNFAMELYEDSCNPDWKERLEKMHVKAVWIYHDKDKWANGEPKKPHHHLMVLWRNTTTFATAQRVTKELGGANGYVEIIRDAESYGRYMCHLDEEDKHKYDIEDVQEVGGADYKKLIGVTQKDKFKALREIIGLCNDRKYNNYCAVVDYCLENREDWVELLLDIRFGRLIQDYIKSMCWEKY